jgi:hypothetical protein
VCLARGADFASIGLPEGDRGQPFGGPLRIFGPWALLCFGCDHTECVLWFVGLFVYFLLVSGRGVFPRY